MKHHELGEARLKGRRPLPADSPDTPEKLMSWLLRSMRIYNFEADVRQTSVFARRFTSPKGPNLRAETINKIETGYLPISLSTCLQYERALGLNDHILVDAYIFLCRLANQVPRKGRLIAKGNLTPEQLDLIIKIAGTEPLSAYEWVHLLDRYEYLLFTV